jgi:hypothetical protein
VVRVLTPEVPAPVPEKTVGPSEVPGTPVASSIATVTTGAPSDAGSGSTSVSPGKIQCGSSTIAVFSR